MSKTPFADLFVRTVKDQLRTVRYRIRSRARVERARAPRPVALAADAVFSQVEAAATVFMPESERRSASLTFPLPISSYFGPETAREDAFTPEIYYALKALLRRFGAAEFLVSEQAVEDARVKLAVRHEKLFKSALEAVGDRVALVARASAAISVELAQARPIRELTPGEDAQARPRNLLLSPNAYCAFVIGLCVAILSIGEDDLDRDVAIGSADMAVDARFAKLSAALRTRDPVTALAGEFSRLLPFLP